MLAQVIDLLARASGQPVVVRHAVYYSEGEGLLCGQAFFDLDLQGFVLGGDTFRRGLTKEQMERVGCFRDGGVVLAP